LCDILFYASVKEKRKEQEKKRILNIDLAVRASQWLRETVYDRQQKEDGAGLSICK